MKKIILILILLAFPTIIKATDINIENLSVNEYITPTTKIIDKIEYDEFGIEIYKPNINVIFYQTKEDYDNKTSNYKEYELINNIIPYYHEVYPISEIGITYNGWILTSTSDKYVFYPSNEITTLEYTLEQKIDDDKIETILIKNPNTRDGIVIFGLILLVIGIIMTTILMILDKTPKYE